MGKPYVSELARLEATFSWALALDLGPLQDAVRRAATLPLVAIGSGGSLTAADFLAGLHSSMTGQIATTATPMEAATLRLNRSISAWLLSASGRNVDILAAFDALVHQEPRQLGILCGRPNSRLGDLARRHPYVDIIDLELPTRRDGFLATNSLLAFCTLFARAYEAEFGILNKPSASFDVDVGTFFAAGVGATKWHQLIAPLLERETLIVLHGPNTRAGAIDLESKFTEAALGNLQKSDYRNFAHGRHHWLAKRGANSAVLAFITDNDRTLAERTLRLIPEEIPTARIDLNGGVVASALLSILAALYIVGWAGTERDIDPGRPGVPEFGRKLYNLRPPKRRTSGSIKCSAEKVAIERKTGLTLDQLSDRGDLKRWQYALRSFERSLSETKFGAIVLDYDGTIVDTRRRFSPPSADILIELQRFLEDGIILGIATGRGASVRRDLQSCIAPSLWPRVLVGYYNGAEVSSLENDEVPDGSETVCGSLSHIAANLGCQTELNEIAYRTDRRFQITLEPKSALPENRLWEIVRQVLLLHGDEKVSFVRSGHSIDVLAPGVTKLNVLKYVSTLTGDGSILKIGDQGRWPGNDFALLKEQHSLSVDELNVDPATCWNLAPSGQRGVAATIAYLRSLHIFDGSISMRVRRK